MELFRPVHKCAAPPVVYFEQRCCGKIPQNVIQLGMELGWTVEKGAIEGELGLFAP